MRRSQSGDAGFSMVEVIFASVIMFVVLTALFGLVSVSLTESKSSASMTRATNLGNMVVEQARSLPFTDVGLVGAMGAEPTGTLPSVETTYFEGVAYTITRIVTWADDPADDGAGGDETPQDYKVFEVDLTWPKGHMRFSTRIRDKSQELSNPPTVSWVNGLAATPADRAVIWNPAGLTQALVWAGDPLQPDMGTTQAWLQAQAQDPDAAGVIARLEYWVDGRPLRNEHSAPLPEYASWTPNARTWTNPRYPVDTLALEASSTNMLFHDGTRQVKVQAWDNQGARDYKIREFIVDNFPPAWPATSSAMITSTANNTYRHDGAIEASFTVAVDGSDKVNRYDIVLRTPTSGDRTSQWVNMGYTGSYTVTWIAGYDVVPFTYYRYSLVPRSPRGLYGATWVNSNGAFSPASLEASCTRSGAKNTSLYFRTTLPRGPWSWASYRLYEAASYSGSGDLAGAVQVFPTNYRIVGSEGYYFDLTARDPGKYYQVIAECMDSYGVKHFVRSNVVGYSWVPGPNEFVQLYPTR